MLKHPDKIINSVIEMKKAIDIPVSVKIRILDNVGDTIDLCKKIEDAGVDFIIIHGRTIKQRYSGKCNWETIKAVKEKIDIPIIGNGDIRYPFEGKRYVDRYYCNSYMIGRAAMSNPMLFSNKEPKDVEERFDLLEQYIEIYKEYIGTPEIADIKVNALQIIRSTNNAAEIRNRICKTKDYQGIINFKEKN